MSDLVRVPAIAPREWAVLCVGGLTLAFTAWGLGGIRLWSLHVLLAGGLLTFLLSIVPLSQRWNGTDGQHGNVQNLKRLLRFPVFWLSLAFLGYLLIQGLNPAWIQLQNESGWWLEEVDAVHWLPSGVAARYKTMNVFRVLASFSAAYLLVCGLWVGLQRRRSIIAVLWIFLLSGVGMAIVAILQKFTGADAVLWTVTSPNSNFWGTFFYRNESVAYLTLIMGLSGALYFYHLNRSEELGVSGGPHLLLFVFIVITLTSIALALSRGGIVFGGLVSICFTCAVIFRWLLASRMSKTAALLLITVLLMGGGSYAIVRYIDVGAIRERFGDIKEEIKMVDQDSRMITTKITWEMFQEEPWFGWGAGSWRYTFPMYQRNYPEIYYRYYNRERGWLGRRVYYYAHNDIVQFLCEYGIFGCAIILSIFVYWVGMLWFRTSGNALGALMLQVCLLAALGHAVVDFILQSPAYWLALHGALFISLKLFLLDAKRGI